MFNCPYATSAFPKYCEPLPKIGANLNEIDEKEMKSAATIMKIAKKQNIWLIAGSMPEKYNEKLYNTCLVLDPTGKVVGKHRKVCY